MPPLGKMYTGIVTGNIVTEGVPPHYQNVKRALDAGVVASTTCARRFETISETHVLDGGSVAANAFTA